MKYAREFTVSVADNGFIIRTDTYKPEYLEANTVVSKDKEEVKAILATWLYNIQLEAKNN